MLMTRYRDLVVALARAAWVKRNGCDPTPVEEEFRESAGHAARRLVYRHCGDGAEVSHWQLTGAGHGWPGAVATREVLVGPATGVVNANAEVWRFLSRFRRAP